MRVEIETKATVHEGGEITYTTTVTNVELKLCACSSGNSTIAQSEEVAVKKFLVMARQKPMVKFVDLNLETGEYK